jgi:hypothetical protein
MGRNPALREAYVVNTLRAGLLLGGAELEEAESAGVAKGAKQLCDQLLRGRHPGSHQVAWGHLDEGSHFGHEVILGRGRCLLLSCMPWLDWCLGWIGALVGLGEASSGGLSRVAGKPGVRLHSEKYVVENYFE